MSQETNQPRDAKWWKTPDTEQAFIWLTAAGSMQSEQLEQALRNYPLPRYDIVDIGRHLIRALSAPMVKFGGSVARVDMLTLAEAVIEYAIANEWDVVEERTVFGGGSGAE